MIYGYYRRYSPHEEAAEETSPTTLLRAERCVRIEVDAPGERTRLAALIKELEHGDVLVAPSCQRLARTAGEICRIAAALHDRRANLRLATERIDTTTPVARLVLTVLGDYERGVVTRHRQNGLREAAARGVAAGRPRKIGASDVPWLRMEINAGRSFASLARELGVHPTTVMRLARQVGEGA
ncbi:recombinase family protein [Magnetospirillum moscoviense]|uniref:Resolvase/invertase-type recombinase catalytic domain-containing protein n=1 Tax=Magnetospirillum moscoviense TaxID=1437059 RepID=A0A178MGH0_9PROT|nr:recombinase family protein [Magnetospirillum moscoviense]MBF0324030.1 recombinase family protein [Alphaproteobacteria bacterium]OAN47726.1 hypothetical protein A6A05_15395 [Magnetospirillum moscoviense]